MGAFSDRGNLIPDYYRLPERRAVRYSARMIRKLKCHLEILDFWKPSAQAKIGAVSLFSLPRIARRRRRRRRRCACYSQRERRFCVSRPLQYSERAPSRVVQGKIRARVGKKEKKISGILKRRARRETDAEDFFQHSRFQSALLCPVGTAWRSSYAAASTHLLDRPTDRPTD